jgi:deazaflavin-dependent oxidoreductase (nitroreductase family)
MWRAAAAQEGPTRRSRILRRFDDSVKRQASTFLSVRVFNPFVKAAARAGLPLFGLAILETTGRRTGQLRRTPVGAAREGDVVWIVAEHGRRAAYVRNIEADPRVRIRLGPRWRSGVASVVPDDDPRARLRSMRRLNATAVRAMGSELLTVRIDLANEKDAKAAA